MKKQNWIWMPHPGHFICSRWCQFILNTYVGGFIVSTLGEYVPDAPVREILAESRDVALKGIGDIRLADYMKKIGYEELSVGYKYETMVFKAKKSGNKCCPYEMKSGSNIDCETYNTADEAKEGHYKLCLKWSKQ